MNTLLHAQKKEWVVLDTSNSGLPVNWIQSLAIDKNGILWIGTQEGGLVKYENEKWKQYNTTNSYNPSDLIHYIF